MIKLYAFPMSCSYAAHVALIASGLPYEKFWLRWPDAILSDGRDYRTVNPRLQTPCIEIDGEGLLTETPAILQYIADQAPDAKLAAPNGTMARTRLQETLNYLSSELHKQVLWTLANLPHYPGDNEHLRVLYTDMLRKRLDYLEDRLGDKKFLEGEQFTIADPLLHVLLFSTKRRVDSLDPWPKLKAYDLRLFEVDAIAKGHADNIQEMQRLLDAGLPA